MKIRVGIIGGGAAGLFAACQFKRLSGTEDFEVTIVERNNIPGKKLILTGHGRCNITNRKDASLLKEGFHEAGNFIYPALREFGPEDTVRFVEDGLGLKTKEEDNNRIFPVCDSAITVRDTILLYLSGSVKTICNAEVQEIKKTDVFEVKTSAGTMVFDRLILSCGGSSFPKTGSTGCSYAFAESLGHTIVPVRGSLAPIIVKPDARKITSALSGVSVNVKLSLLIDGKVTASQRREMLFAEFGITGPAAMELSREVPPDIKGINASVEADLIPDMSDEAFDQEMQKLICDHPDTKITTILSRYMPASAAEEVATLTGTAGLYAQGFTKENRRKLINGVKHLKMEIAEVPQIEKAYVTRGGVSLKEVDRKTMQSKKTEGLYIIGEALDIDGISGGYNLQACMSGAYLAVKSILKSV